jgi:hypothetical protein
MATTTNNGWETPDDTDLVKDGALAMRTLGNGIDTSVGTGLLAWQSFAPTLSGGWLNGNGTWEAFYVKIGKIIHVDACFTLGSTTTKGTGLTISLPVTAKRPGTNVRRTIGNVIGFIGSGFHAMTMLQNTTTSVTLYAINSATSYAQAANVTTVIPATWGTGDSFHFSFTYEAA